MFPFLNSFLLHNFLLWLNSFLLHNIRQSRKLWSSEQLRNGYN